MRDDLLDAQACVDWAVAQLKILQDRLIAWREDTPYRLREDVGTKTGEKLIRLCDIKLPPPIINAEVGIIIHALRSSLDVLINGLAERNGHVAPKDAYLPICRDYTDFTTGKHAGRKAIKRLSAADQAIIEKLEPWRGGNNPILIALHDLDIIRKHRRLITVSMEPFMLMAQTYGGAGRPIRFHEVKARFENDAVVRRMSPNLDAGEIQLAFDVTLSEGGVLAGKHVVAAIEEFTRLADSIINLFDDPRTAVKFL